MGAPYRFNSLFKKVGLILVERDGWNCHYCGRLMTRPIAGGRATDATVDHVYPYSRGGSDDLNNLVLACKSCNSKKHNRLPEEMQ